MPAFLIREPKCVFIHIPKTGGMSIRRQYFDMNYEGPSQNHLPDEWKNEFAFGFVRNPYDRIVSAWKMFSQGMDAPHWQFPADLKPGMDLRTFLQIVTDDSLGYPEVRTTYQDKIRNHTMPQSHPFALLQHADFIGRFENLAEDFAKICQKLALKDANLGHLNKSNRGPFEQYFDPITKAIVADYYAEDFAQFGYSRDWTTDRAVVKRVA